MLVDEKPVKRGKGRPKFVPTAEQIKELARLYGIGLNYNQLAAWLEISPQCFDELLVRSPEIKQAISKAKSSAIGNVAESLYQQAVSGKSPAMTIFYLKTQARWSEPRDTEPTDDDKDKAKDFVLNYRID